MRRTIALTALVFVVGCAGKEKAPVVDPEPATTAEKQLEIPEQSDPPAPETQGVEEPETSSPPETEEPEPEVEDTSEQVLTTKNLCEPIDERWKYPTAEQKKKARALIRKTCKEMGVGREDCKYFSEIVSVRESAYRWWVRHKLAGDVAAAANAYLSRSRSYGWSVHWDPKARKQEDLSKIEFEPHGDLQNEYFKDAERWLFGLGLGALNIPYHLVKFDRTAPPEILCDPVINTMIQVTIARNAVRKYGAKNFAEIQAVYAGRTYHDENGRVRPMSCTRGCPKVLDAAQRQRARKGDARILGRCKTRGLDCYKRPQLGDRLRLKSLTPEERYEAAERIRGEPLPPFDEPPIDGIDLGVTEG